MAEAEVAEAEAGWGWDGNFSLVKDEKVMVSMFLLFWES